MSEKSKLPPKTKDKVVEISLKHVIWSFAILAAGTAALGSGMILLRDYAKFKRQKAILESAKELIIILKGDDIWKNKKETSPS